MGGQAGACREGGGRAGGDELWGVFGASAGDARVVGGGGAGGPAAVFGVGRVGRLGAGVGAFAGGGSGDGAGAGCEADGVMWILTVVGGFIIDLAAKGKVQIQTLAPPPPEMEVTVDSKTGRRRIEETTGPRRYGL